jgi:hypothetical protein
MNGARKIADDRIVEAIETLRKRSQETESRLVVLLQVAEQTARHYDALRVQIAGLSIASAGVVSAFVAQLQSNNGDPWCSSWLFGLFVCIALAFLAGAIFFQSAYLWHWWRMYFFRRALLVGERLEPQHEEKDLSQVSLKHLAKSIDDRVVADGWRRRLFPWGSGEAALEGLWIALPALVVAAALVAFSYSTLHVCSGKSLSPHLTSSRPAPS